jgi:hypothetical protein
MKTEVSRRSARPFVGGAGLALLLAVVFGALAPDSAAARICVMDNVPAATLLLPYFEVDLDRPAGANTSMSINNAFAEPVIAKLELWTDLGVPIFGFNIYLKGYDMQTLSLGDIVRGGILPNTEPSSGIPPSCAGGALNVPPIVGAQLICHHNSFTGRASSCLGGLCAGVSRPDRIARGYVTIDVVNGCTPQLPTSPGYFRGVASNRNALWGDYFYTNAELGLAEGEPLVHIEADSTDPETSIPGEYTFYGKYVGWSAADNREPLATNFGVRFFNSPSITSDVIVWRDSKVAAQGAFFCPSQGGSYPSWYPLGQESVRIIDEAGNITANPVTGFGAATQRTAVGGPGLPVPFPFGWFFLNFNTLVPASGFNPPEDPSAAQAWVTLISRAPGGISVGYRGLLYDSACEARHASNP